MEERQTNYTIMEGYELPSKGKIYDTEVNPHVELRSMTARDEMKRLSPSTTPLKTLADIIEGCLIEKPAIHVYDMCLGDYEFLLHKLRIVTYGTKYKVGMQCPICGDLIETTADLGTLEVVTYDEDQIEKLRVFNCPSSNDLIVLKFLTPRIIESAASKAREALKKTKSKALDFNTLYQIMDCIETINGDKLNSYELEHYLLDLPAIDFQKISSNIADMSAAIGVKSNLTVTCPTCGEDSDTFFRFGPEFFRSEDI